MLVAVMVILNLAGTGCVLWVPFKKYKCCYDFNLIYSAGRKCEENVFCLGSLVKALESRLGAIKGVNIYTG